MLHFVTFGDKKGGAGQVLPVRLFETPDFQKLASGQNLPLFAIPLFATLSILKPMIFKMEQVAGGKIGLPPSPH